MILHRLELLPGEHLGAVVGRMHVLSTHGTFTATAQMLGLSSPQIRPHRLCHPDDPVLDTQFRARHVQRTWQDHSVGNYLASFLTPDEQRIVASALVGRSQLRLRVTGLHNVQHQYWRWCADCIAEDYELHGMPYYHRDHQLPGVFHCHRHQRGLSGHCAGCGFSAKLLSEQLIPPYDSLCPHCGHWMGGYDGHFTERMHEIELASLALAQSASALTLCALTQLVTDSMGISGEAMRTVKSIKTINAWFQQMDSQCDPLALTAYFTNSGGPGQVWQLPPQLRNARGYHEKSARDPLHPLAHLMMLQHAGVDLVELLGSEG
ncbi:MULTISPECIES: TniQ family protein [Aeromonas]|uniref:TniQ domain-containing protein n=2 Tax=Aeromonas TaxID=642 RepID=A0A6M4YBC3_AERME|nr:MULTISPECIES: TniQ family protein [Aeromonas]AUV15295.1 hypothetical protein C2U47_00490 [Aeromonas sp. ASNIH7]MDM5109005.1 TniQ family protein [Aeromonas caviae]MDX7917618.1 TniQ family protein [Aeromonas caviae]QJT22280.1 hypothetical protein E4184_13205 [Aeromonas media]QYK82705.1 TniQ family protein [Aeromonas media]